MAIDLFRLDIKAKILTPISSQLMEALHLTEAGDLEDWLASSGKKLFGREILWIARQDRPNHEQRSDIIGVAGNGDLLITELKRGMVDEAAVTQALGYAAEYKEKTAEDLENLFFEHSSKTGPKGLVVRAASLEDAKKRLADHLGPEVEINETQIITLLGEQFSAKALAICNYLNNSVRPDLCSFECWRYSIHIEGGDHFLAIEQLLPPPSARVLIEERREESKSRKYARDPVRVTFMQKVMEALYETEFKAERNRGQSYDCRITNAAWPKDVEIRFSVKEQHPSLWIPTSATFAPPAASESSDPRPQEGYTLLVFTGMESTSAQHTDGFQKRLVEVVRSIRFGPPIVAVPAAEVPNAAKVD